MKNQSDLISAWIDKAEKDLLSAVREKTFDHPVTETVCFHCQQSAEKYIKAYLIFLDINFPRTHDLGLLGKLIAGKDDEFRGLISRADLLSDYAVEIRYPDDFNEPTIEEADDAIQIANEIKNYITSKVIQ